MKPAGLGLVCKDALEVFSQNETLALQQRVAELEARLERHEILDVESYAFPDEDSFYEKRGQAMDFMRLWLEDNYGQNLHESSNSYWNDRHLIEAIQTMVEMVIGQKALCSRVAKICYNLVHEVCEACDDVAGPLFSEDRHSVVNTVEVCISNFVFDHLESIGATRWPKNGDFS